MEVKNRKIKTENPFLKYFGDDQEEFEKEWNKLTNEIGGDVLKFFQTNIQENFRLDELLGINKLTVIVDNNFLFSYIRGLAVNFEQNDSKRPLEDSFIYKFFTSEFIEVFAPPKIRKEIFEKIECKIGPENIDRAKELANRLLSKIEITEAYSVDSWIKASKKLRDDDPDDIDYLALVYHKNGHAIISDDKVFEKTGSYESWSNLETKEVLLRCNKGIVAFSVIGLGMATFSALIKYLLLFFKIVTELISQMADVLLRLLANIVGTIAKMPVALAAFAIIAGLTAWFTFSEKDENFIIKKSLKLLTN